MATPVDFPKYLQSLVKSYKKQQHLYTLTDLQVEVRVEKPPEDRSQPRSPENKPETKIERLEVLAGIRKYVQQGNVLLVGKPGSGKSTVLQRFRWEWALEALENGDRPIPVLVELRYDQSIVDAICAEFENAQLIVSPEEVKDLRVHGKLLLLLDGVNEMPSQQRRQELQLFLHNKNSPTRMIFTTRDLALGGSLGIEQQLEMCALTQPQMREFVHKHLPQHGDLLLGQLRDGLREVAETPLFLWMLCKVFKPDLKIPQSKGELFQEFDRQYDEFKGVPSVSEDFRRFKPDLLDHLAFVMLQGDSERPTDGWVAISRRKAEGILECGLRDRGVVDAPTKAKEWLEDLLEHHLLQVAAKRKEIEFHHQLFQEYYAGRALGKLFDDKHPDVTDDERLQHFYLNYLKWREPLAFMVSLLEDDVQAVRVVRLALEVDLMLGARLAGEVQREFQKRTVGLVDELDVPRWLKVELLGEARSDEAIPGLLKLLEDSDSDVRRMAADALGKIGSEAAIPGLLKLVEDSDSEVRSIVAYAFGEIASDATISGLFKLVEDSDSDVRNSVAYALGAIGSDVAISGLFKLVEDSEPDVRWTVAEALGEIASEAAIPGLLQFVQDSDSQVRIMAANALGEIGSEAAIPGLLQLVEDSELEVRITASKALGQIGFDAIPGLLPLVKDSESEVGITVADALSGIDNDEQFRKWQEDMSKIATETLEKIDYELSIKNLLKLINNPEYYVQFSGKELLEKISYDVVILGLIKLVEDSDFDVRNNAASMLVIVAEQNTEGVVWYLPHLLTLIPSESGEEVHRLILAIQAACKYYNYPIHQLSLAPHPAKPSQPTELLVKIEQRLQQMHKTTKQMADQPTQDFSHATFKSLVNFGPNHGTQAHHLHIAAQQSSPEAALNAVVQIIQALEKKYSYVQDEQQARNIIDAEFKEIKEQKPIEWQNLINLKRVYNGGKNAAVKVGEHFAESSPWVKGFVGFLEGISEDVN